MKELKVRVTFIEEVLGLMPSSPEIHREYIASKAPNAETIEQEVENHGVDAVVEKGMTIFPRTEDGAPFFYDYQIRGMFKDVCSALRKVPGTKSEKCKAFKKQIDGLIFVEPRKCAMDLHGGTMGNCQRPLRAQTVQGERVSLANSETVPVGTTLEFTVICFVDADVAMVKEWLEYGRVKGMGQWRNSGKGKFTVEFLD